MNQWPQNMPAKWTKIQHTPLAVVAQDILRSNEKRGCYYHNTQHIISMYEYLNDTHQPYDEALDWAVLFHDIVYDANPKKEERSAEAFLSLSNDYSGCSATLDKLAVYNMIYATRNHIVRQPNVSAIIRADLHGLCSEAATIYNFGALVLESHYLYNSTPAAFAAASYDFMEILARNMQDNQVSDPKYYDFYTEVLSGIKLTQKLAQAIK